MNDWKRGYIWLNDHEWAQVALFISVVLLALLVSPR